MKSSIVVFMALIISTIYCPSVHCEDWQELLNRADSLESLHKNGFAAVETEKALKLAEINYGKSDTIVARILHRIAFYNSGLRKFEKAANAASRAIRINESVYGEDSPQLTRDILLLGFIRRRQERYNEALLHCKRAVEIEKKSKNDLKYGLSLMYLATTYKRLYNYEKSEQLFNQALSTLRNLDIPDPGELSRCLFNIASLYAEQSRYEEAILQTRKAIALRKKAFGPDHPDYWTVAQALNYLGTLLLNLKKYEEAENCHLEALQIEKRAFKRDDYFSLGVTLSNLSYLYEVQGLYKKAEETLLTAINILENHYGRNHPELALRLESLGRLKRIQGHYDEACLLTGRAARIQLDYVKNNTIFMPEQDALTATKNIHSAVANHVVCFQGIENPDSSRLLEVFNLIFLSKGLVTDDTFRRHRTFTNIADDSSSALLARLKDIKSELSQSYVKGPGADSNAYSEHMDSLSQIEFQLELNLARRNAGYGEKFSNYSDILKRLSLNLPENSTLVEYFKYSCLYKAPDSIVSGYMVVIVSAGSLPVIVDLGDAKKIDNNVAAYRSHMERIAEYGNRPEIADQFEYKDISLRLLNSIWSPIDKYLSNENKVFIAPDGQLNLVSFAGLTDSSGRYLIEKYEIHYLSSGRDLLRLEQKAESGKGLYAIGGPDFNASVDERFSNCVPPTFEHKADNTYVARNVRSLCTSLTEIILSPLLGSIKEVRAAKNIWETFCDEPVLIRLGEMATEDSFKKEAPGSRVIHIATHGYYISNSYKYDKSDDIRVAEENPLLHSGLFLAGANLHGDGADSAGVNDGILTAYEVSAMNLEGADLVILSACDTGLGEMQTGEGVYGLRRAFQMAGVQTVVTTFWPISDKAAAEIMPRLYEKKDQSWPVLMRKIQIDKINELREQGLPDHPIIWGSFCAIGDWR